MTHWKRQGLGAGGEGDDREWDGWMASLTRWTWVWVNSGSWWWTGRPGVLQFMGSQRVGHDWATELNWSEVIWHLFFSDLLHVAWYPQDPSMLSQMTRFLFHDWIIFHCTCEWVWESVCYHIVFTHSSITGHYLGYCKCCCNEHEGASIFWN